MTNTNNKTHAIGKWGAVIPQRDKPIPVVCPQCGGTTHSRRATDFVYALHKPCGWGDYKMITTEWQTKSSTTLRHTAHQDAA